MARKAVGRSRRRHKKENATAEAIIDSAAQAAAEERVLGTTVSGKTADASLFVVDRSAVSKAELNNKVRAESLKELRQRRMEKPNRSEALPSKETRVAPVPGNIPGRKKKRTVAGVEVPLIAKRTSNIQKRKAKAPGFRMDVWDTDLANVVATEKNSERRRMEQKMNAAVRSSKSVLKPDDGLSVNPAFQAHQDALGVATASILDEKIDSDIAKRKMSFDPRILEVCAKEEREAAKEEDEMKDDEVEDESEEQEALPKSIPQRKTRTMRNREKRRKASDIRHGYKIARRRMRRDLDNLEAIAEEAIREADKINGETKRRALESNPPLKPENGAPLHKEIAKEKVRSEANSVRVPLSSDLAMSVRSVKMPQSNAVLRDRFLSFERRGIVEPTPVLKKERKQAEQARRAHELRERRPRKNFRGSRSNISYWRQKGK